MVSCTFPAGVYCISESASQPLSERSFWSYELSKRAIAREDDSDQQRALQILLCGGFAGVVTWASIFPLGRELAQFFTRVTRTIH